MPIKRKIGVFRPGANGDLIMMCNVLPLLKQKFFGYDIDLFTAINRDMLGFIYDQVGINQIFSKDVGYNLEFRKNYDHFFIPMGYPLKEGYPDKPMRKHLIQHFADDLGLNVGNSLPCLELKRMEPLINGNYVTVHCEAGWSLYKNWEFHKWEQVIAEYPEVRFVQIGAPDNYKLKGADHSFFGRTMPEAINLISNASFHMGVDSFSNHVTHLKFGGRQTPALILFGSSQATASGYSKNINVSLNLPCQPCFKEDPVLSIHPRGICTNPEGQTSYYEPKHACMANISTEHIANIVGQMIDKHMGNGAVLIS